MAQVVITTSANGVGGTVLPATGNQEVGSVVVLTAIPVIGYDFVSWTLGGSVVSSTANYALTVSTTQSYVANFVLHEITTDDYNAIKSYMNAYYTYAGMIGNAPNYTKAARLQPTILRLSIELQLFDTAKLKGLDTATHYENIVDCLNTSV